MRTCGERCHVIIGDARLSLGHTAPNQYGLIVLDAFSSDAIPVHLITREAVQTLRDKLSDGGILAYHISNRYLDLEAVLGNLSADLGLPAWIESDYEDKRLYPGKASSTWVLLARKPEDLTKVVEYQLRRIDENEALPEEERAKPHPWEAVPVDPKVGIWTDDYSNLLSVFKR